MRGTDCEVDGSRGGSLVAIAAEREGSVKDAVHVAEEERWNDTHAPVIEESEEYIEEPVKMGRMN